MAEILTPVLLVTSMGMIFGLILAIASKYMNVSTDEEAEELLAVLPGINCGACGFSGCEDYATNLKSKTVPTNLCTPGGEETSIKISEILGLPTLSFTPKVARVRCSGDYYNRTEIMDYGAKPTCKDANSFYQGTRSCTYGCLGFGDCVKVCIYGALEIKNGIAVVDRELCTGCKKCEEVCPDKLISVDDASSKVFVACLSNNNGAFTRKICQAGCIGCRQCEKQCKFDAIIVKDNLASIDYEKCTNCGECVTICPTNTIKHHL